LSAEVLTKAEILNHKAFSIGYDAGALHKAKDKQEKKKKHILIPQPL
jgi:hypothetical protein